MFEVSIIHPVLDERHGPRQGRTETSFTMSKEAACDCFADIVYIVEKPTAWAYGVKLLDSNGLLIGRFDRRDEEQNV